MVSVAKSENIVECMYQLEERIVEIINQKLFKLSLILYLYGYSQAGDLLRNSKIDDVSDIQTLNEKLKKYHLFLWLYIPRTEFATDSRTGFYYSKIDNEDIKLSITFDNEL